MATLYCIFSVVVGFQILILSQAEHHEIPIISNYTTLNNTFTVTQFLNFSGMSMEMDNEMNEELYDDGVALMEDYEEGETNFNDYNPQMDEPSVRDLSDEGEDDDEDEDSDFKFMTTRARWSYAPGFVERMCRKECRQHGKPFGRLLGVRCQCYCPLNAPTLNLCATTGKCDRYCSSIGYPKGGDCVYNNVCFCNCRKKEAYDVSQVYIE